MFNLARPNSLLLISINKGKELFKRDDVRELMVKSIFNSLNVNKEKACAEAPKTIYHYLVTYPAYKENIYKLENSMEVVSNLSFG